MPQIAPLESVLIPEIAPFNSAIDINPLAVVSTDNGARAYKLNELLLNTSLNSPADLKSPAPMRIPVLPNKYTFETTVRYAERLDFYRESGTGSIIPIGPVPTSDLKRSTLAIDDAGAAISVTPLFFGAPFVETRTPQIALVVPFATGSWKNFPTYAFARNLRVQIHARVEYLGMAGLPPRGEYYSDCGFYCTSSNDDAQSYVNSLRRNQKVFYAGSTTQGSLTLIDYSSIFSISMLEKLDTFGIQIAYRNAYEEAGASSRVIFESHLEVF